MRLFSPSATARLAGATLLFSTLALSTQAQAQPEPGPEWCNDFVYLENGKFKADGQGYQLKGVNFGFSITAKQNPTADAYEYFLAPVQGSRPDNNAICDHPWSDRNSCCDS